MNIALYIEGQEVELNDKVQFAVTRTFEELSNPTVICNDWSKTIQIPFTNSNNRLFGSIFNIERSYVDDNYGLGNKGQYFNPLKKANFKLFYNSGLICTGYMKMASVNNVSKTYEVNLFGEVGNTFLELLECTFNENDVNMVEKGDPSYDDGKVDFKYYINNPITKNRVLNRTFVKESWDNDSPILDLDDENIKDTDIIGFAPVSQGLVKEFANDTYLSNGEFKKFGELLNGKKGITYGDTIIGDGLTERQFGQYRSKYQKPYIYVNKLWQLFVKKSEEICEYPLHLDPVWFNEKNPYYTDLIYMCNDFIDGEGATKKKYVKSISINPTAIESYPYEFNASFNGNKIGFTINSGLTNSDMKNSEYKDKRHYTYYKYGISPFAYLKIGITNKSNVTQYYAVISDMKDYDGNEPYRPTESNITIIQPTPQVIGTLLIGFSIDYDCSQLVNGNSITYQWVYKDWSGKPYVERREKRDGLDYTVNYKGLVGNTYVTVNNANAYYEEDIVTLGRIWNPDLKPFKVLLNYSKMYGLIYYIDHEKKYINVTCRNIYFSRYKILDWTDKVNTLNKYTIEQPTFDSKYVVFNYDSVDADRYKEYEDKYRTTYGSKKLITDYEFNNNEEKLYEGITPTNVINENISSWTQIYNEWVVPSAIPVVTNKEVYFDNLENKEPANIYSSFAFRRKNQNVDARLRSITLTDDTQYERNAQTYCYLDDNGNGDYMTKNITKIPYIHYVDETGKYGCLFAMPKEIYVTDRSLVENAGFIYDNFWRDYINERYSPKNKKVNLQVNLSPIEYSNFEFNNFVKINNTIFIVNKINDYDITNGENTDVELITITDINGYTGGLTFEYAYFEDDKVTVISNTQSNNIIETTVNTNIENVSIVIPTMYQSILQCTTGNIVNNGSTVRFSVSPYQSTLTFYRKMYANLTKDGKIYGKIEITQFSTKPANKPINVTPTEIPNALKNSIGNRVISKDKKIYL